jgi:hypothetical protein
MSDDWRVYRPAIWMAMLGIAVLLLVSPWYLAAFPLGAALGLAFKITRQRQRQRQPRPQPQRRR